MLIKASENRKSLMWELCGVQGKGRSEVPGWRLQSLYSARDDSSKILRSGSTFLCATYMQELGVRSEKFMEISPPLAIAAVRRAARDCLDISS